MLFAADDSKRSWMMMSFVESVRNKSTKKKTSVIQLGFGLKTFWILVKHSYHLIEPVVVEVKTIKLRKQH